jgi:small subunit ribosomal protein S25e
MAKTEIKSKEAKMKAAMSGGKSKRKKWSKGRVREKLANAILYDQKTLDRLTAEVPKLKMITIATVSERLKVGGSMARAGIRELVTKGLIRPVSYNSKMPVYSRATGTD